MKPWTIGTIGLAGLAVFVGGAYTSPEVLLGVAILVALAVGIGWPHFLGIPAKKTLAAIIGLPWCGLGRGCHLRPGTGLP